jgi:catechol 2,3-dioxygenase-like lactoylglutathione lyase family enzyme
MIHHIDFGVVDIGRSRDFYERALAPLGLTVVMAFTNREGRQLIGFGSPPDPVFWIRDGQPISGRLHVAFQASSRASVDAFHAAAVHAGGKDNGSARSSSALR